MRGLRAETGMMEPQIEEWLEPPEAANGKEQSLPQSFWRVSSLPRHLEFGLPASGKCERIHLCVLSHQGDGICYSSQRKKLVQSLCGLGHEMTVRANLGHLFPCFLPSDGERSISLLFVKLGSGHVLILEPTKAPQGKGRR